MSLRHAVLGLLADQPASGYDLMKRFDGSLDNVWSATQSQVYGELAKAAETGWITASAEGPRGRKEYALTEAGRAELRRWLVDVAPGGSRRNDALLRVFFLGQLTPAQARQYLADYAATSVARAAELTTLREEAPRDGSSLVRCGMLALEWGLRQERMTQEWAAWAAEQIEGPDAEPSAESAAGRAAGRDAAQPTAPPGDA